MTIQIGDTIPSLTLMQPTENGPMPIGTEEIFPGKTVVLVAVPGAFTPTCSARHLPGFVEQAAAFKAKGVDDIVCMSVNDAFVMKAWGQAQNVGDSVRLLADGNGDLTRALGLEMNGNRFGMGTRAQRFAMVVKDGVVNQLFVEAPGEFKVSSADHVLAQL